MNGTLDDDMSWAYNKTRQQANPDIKNILVTGGSGFMYGLIVVSLTLQF